MGDWLLDYLLQQDDEVPAPRILILDEFDRGPISKLVDQKKGD